MLLASAGDAAPAPQRASAIGLYRLWRDLGFVVGAVAAGWLADALGIATTLDVLAAITLTSAALSAMSLRHIRSGAGPSRSAPSPARAMLPASDLNP